MKHFNWNWREGVTIILYYNSYNPLSKKKNKHTNKLIISDCLYQDI